MFFDPKTTVPGRRTYVLRLQGNGVNPVTTELGRNVIATRTGVGVYKVAFTDNPGIFTGWDCQFGAAVPSSVAGFTAVRGLPVAATPTASASVSFSVFNAAQAATDLAVSQFVDLEIDYAETQP